MRTDKIRWAALILLVGTALILFLISGTNIFAGHLDPGGPTTTHGVQPIQLDGNPTCSTVASAGTIEFKLEPVESGTFSDGTLTVTIDVYNTPDGQAFDFDAEGGAIFDVVVKAGPAANWYNYDGELGFPVTDDTFLHGPVNDSNNRFYGLSHISFCYLPTFTKSGMKWHDLDADGMKEEGEPPLEGWEIRAYADDGDGILQSSEYDAGAFAIAFTDAEGNYSMELQAGTDFIVCEVADDDTSDSITWHQSAPSSTADCSAGGDLAPFGYAVNLTADDPDNDFGNYQNATKSGHKYHDLNASGTRDEGEPGLPNWQICADGTCTNTNDVGYYELSLKPGSYTVSETCPEGEGWIQSEPTPSADTTEACGTGVYDITLTSGEIDDGNNFGNYQNATKSGYKFHDLNADGMWQLGGDGEANTGDDGEEPTLSGWQICADDGTCDTTDGMGYYELSLKPGDYIVSETCPEGEGWIQSKPTPDADTTEACGTGVYDITLTSGEIDDDNDFGNYQNATKSGYKFKDANNNGSFDTGDLGLNGWTIKVYNTSGLVDTYVTANDGSGNPGYYEFSLKPGDYIVCEVAQDNWEQTQPVDNTVCGFDAALEPGGYGITLVSQEVDDDNNFGNTPLSDFDVRFFDLTGFTNATIECEDIDGERVGSISSSTEQPETVLTAEDLLIGTYTCKITIVDP